MFQEASRLTEVEGRAAMHESPRVRESAAREKEEEEEEEEEEEKKK